MAGTANKFSPQLSWRYWKLGCSDSCIRKHQFTFKPLDSIYDEHFARRSRTEITIHKTVKQAVPIGNHSGLSVSGLTSRFGRGALTLKYIT
jgi:hypothetical protein